MKKTIKTLLLSLSLVVAFVCTCLLTACGETPTVAVMIIKQLPEKTEYLEGEYFDPTGLILAVQYSDGSGNNNVTEGYDWDLKDPLTEDDDEVRISFGGKVKYIDIEVNVKTPSDIVVVSQPDKLMYVPGERFDPTGLVLKVTFDDGEEKEISSGFVYTSSKLKDGTTFITVRYNGKSINIPIIVAQAVSSLEITKGPDTTTYMAGQFFDPTGMVVKATYEDGSSADVTAYCSMPKDRLAAGNAKATIAAGGKTVDQPITVSQNPHTYQSSVERVESTCTTNGNVAYATCSHCDKYFTDEYCAYEIEDVVLPFHHEFAMSESNPTIGAQVAKCSNCGHTESPDIYYNFTSSDIIKGSVDSAIMDTRNHGSLNVQNANQFAYQSQYILNLVYEGDAVTFNFNAKKAGEVTFAAKMSSVYFVKAGESWKTGDMQLNKVASIKVNDKEAKFGNDVILYGSSSLKGTVGSEGNKTYANTVNWQYITFTMPVVAGANTVTISAKGCKEYPDINTSGRPGSSFTVDTLAVYGLTGGSIGGEGGSEGGEEQTYDLNDTNTSLTHNFTPADQISKNNNNPPQNRYDLSLMATATTTSANVKKATALAENEDYLTHFYGGAAVSKHFISAVAGKATVTFTIASGYLLNTSAFDTGDMIVNKVMKFTVNGTDVVLSDDVKLLGRTTGSYASMGTWTEVTFEIDVQVGMNTIVLTSLFPEGEDGNLLYKDVGEYGTQSTFQLDTVKVVLK